MTAQKTAERIYIFDTTLRDGQQSPGAGMSFEDNLQYADYAHQLKIDILEAGFPAAAKTDFNIVHAISKRMADIKSDMRIAGLCQLREEQCIKTMEALAPSLAIGKARVHTYVPVDPHLMQASLGEMAHHPEQIIAAVYKIIAIATREGYEVEFSPEGYSRMQHHFDFTLDLIRAAIEAGARIINCPDTIGGASKYEGEQYFVKNMQKHADIIKREFPEHNIIWSAHCHNDFGLALENTMNAVFEGPARQIEGCINGVGERSGNVALEQCIMYIKQFGDQVNDHEKFYTNINPIYLQKISNFIAEKMLPRQPHSPIVGINAARHTSGGHTNAILKNPLAYQPFDPKDIGNEISFAFGPLSGSNHAKEIIERSGYRCDADEKVEIAQFIKDYYHERRKGVTDQELISAYLDYRKPIKIYNFEYGKKNNDQMLELHGQFFDEDSHVKINYQGTGSALSALEQAICDKMGPIQIESYKSEAKGKKITALSTSTIVISTEDQKTFMGIAEDPDIEISALKALIDATNQAYIDRQFVL